MRSRKSETEETKRVYVSDDDTGVMYRLFLAEIVDVGHESNPSVIRPYLDRRAEKNVRPTSGDTEK